jgi:endonuclease I
MKKIYQIILLCNFSFAIAQPSATYYSTATGSGYTLKTQLYNIIKGHTVKSYNELYVTYLTSDVDNFYENDGTILDMYSENPNGVDPYNYGTGPAQRCGNYSVEGDCYNREHIIPQSVFNSSSPMVSDAHFITPTDGKVNGIRSNYPHGIVTNPTTTTQNGGKLGQASNTGIAVGYSGIVFEPIDAFKGDIARMYFYFATRYENLVAGYSFGMFNGTSDQVFTNTFKNILLQWNLNDPVSPREIARNNAIGVVARQGNRNPYIDNNAYVQQIWGLAPSQLGISNFDLNANISVYPNPSNDNKINISSDIAIDEINLFNINGQLIQIIQKPVFENNILTLENIPQGFYFLKLTSDNQSLTKKVMIN